MTVAVNVILSKRFHSFLPLKLGKKLLAVENMTEAIVPHNVKFTPCLLCYLTIFCNHTIWSKQYLLI